MNTASEAATSPASKAATSPAAGPLVVLHRNIPGPLSADPHDRVVFRRICDLVRAGTEVVLIARERLPEGGAPRTLRDLGVRLIPSGRSSVTDIIHQCATPGATLIVTDALLPPSHREAVLEWPGARLCDLQRLRSAERMASRAVLRVGEQPGIDTEVAHLREIESELLAACDGVMVTNRALLAAVAALAPSCAPTVVPPSPAPPAGLEHEQAPRRVVVPARLTDEWATPDEAALWDLLATSGLRELSDEHTDGVAIAPEDVPAKLRQVSRSGIGPVELHESARACTSA
ncbi:MAG: hypothetical protein ACK5O2_07580, partial [Microthrixaceae bacterium]